MDSSNWWPENEDRGENWEQVNLLKICITKKQIWSQTIWVLSVSDFSEVRESVRCFVGNTGKLIQSLVIVTPVWNYGYFCSDCPADCFFFFFLFP